MSKLDPDDRAIVFIDGSNTYTATKALGFDIDYEKLLKLFDDKCKLIRIMYYTALLDRDVVSSLRGVTDWLSYNGYTVISKPAKEFTDDQGRVRIKGNVDVELSVGMLEAANHIDHAILFSGDGDFRALVEAVQKRGVKVTVVSTIKSSPPIASDDLRRQADAFIDLYDLCKYIKRDRPNPKHEGGK